YVYYRQVLDRLGRIDDQLITDRFFREELLTETAAHPDFAQTYAEKATASVLPGGTLEAAGQATTQRAGSVLVIGADDDFWNLGQDASRPARLPTADEIILNRPLADELQVSVGDRVLLRLPKSNQVPADSPLGRKTDLIRTLADLTVIDIIEPIGLGRFSLSSSQRFPLNAYVSTASLQRALEQPRRVNALFLAARDPRATRNTPAMITPRLTDLGLTLQSVQQTFRPDEAAETITVFDYLQLSSERLLLDENVVQVAQNALRPHEPQPVFTYLANSIAKVGDQRERPVSIPYSMVTAVDANDSLGPLRDRDGKPIAALADDEIVLNSWAAEDLQAEAGDRIRLAWFAPETTHGESVEVTAEFRLRAIVPVTEPAHGFEGAKKPRFDERPTQANDPDLTPTVKGVTDQDSIDDWDPPFPFDQRRVRPRDDSYWNLYRTTPKAFVSLATGQRLWGSRFGRVTSVRLVPRPGMSVDLMEQFLARKLMFSNVRMGFDIVPVKQRSLAAARGTTPFDALFLSLSFFIIAAALVLVALLYRLSMEQRATEIGVLLALGWPLPRLTRLLAGEGLFVALVGGALGVALGIGYAWLMITGLTTWWVGAIATPFLELHVTTRSLLLGYASGSIVSTLVILFTLWRVRKVPVRQLIAGRMTGGASAEQQRTRRRWFTPIVTRGTGAALWLAPLAALGLAGFATRLVAEAQAGAFVASGMLLLGTLLVVIWRWFARVARNDHQRSSAALSGGLWELAARNAGRNPGRSVLTIGLVAAACFLIVAMSAFRLAPTAAGTGGFAWIAQSSQPIFADLNSEDVRDELPGNTGRSLQGSTILSLRLQPGEDASCANLYQATQPRVLGVSAALMDYFDDPAVSGFRFAATASAPPSPASRVSNQVAAPHVNPWRLLQAPATAAANSTAAPPAIPVILDKNTALYSLHLYGGIGQTFAVKYDGHEPINFQVVGLLDNSVLQGSLLIDEQRFTKLFPEISGYRYFLIRTAPEREANVAAALEDAFSDQGLDATSAPRLLADFLAVQNTYLSTFQSLGALGLLLGTFGLATIQLRNVFERRGELALLRALGFEQRRLALLVLAEHLVLLLGGLTVGTVAALVAVIQHRAVGGTQLPVLELTAWLLLILT
ncbi:MAG: FtsX-like permease family protein, partial [Planctomycetota bacterium]